MTISDISSYSAGQWIGPGAGARMIASAVTGDVIAQAGNDSLDIHAMLDHAREKGGPALRAMTFHQRAKMVKALAAALNEQKNKLYEISFSTGATARDHMIDVDGGIGTMFVFSSKGRKELPDSQIYLDGDIEQLAKGGTFLGQHVCTSKQGVAVHINAFNFPVWGMLEKLAPTLLAGMPAIVKPATATCYVTELAVRIMIESGVLPDGALQFVTGGIGDMLDHLTSQDVVSFTGSADTALKLRSNPNLLRQGIPFIAEQDSLNASILGPDADPESPEFDLFVKEVSREMTVKAGQKCTAIRRILVPENRVEGFQEKLIARLSKTVIGDPNLENTQMGALVSTAQRADVLEKASLIAKEAERVYGDPEGFELNGGDREKGAFLSPMLFHCANPDAAKTIHEVEAFGPVSTILPYRDLDHAISLVNRGGGSLVTSVITHDPDVARQVTLGAAAYNGRLYINNRDSMKESTGHGSPLPHLVHGGPGRAGGGEEMGGVRGVMHYMQRTSVQGSPDILRGITDKWIPGSTEIESASHPFTRKFGDLVIGESILSDSRAITVDDIETFAEFTGDTFYAHMDDEAAARNPFFPGRVAHGYLVLSFAAGLFVQPDEGPVLANYGLENLRFTKPVVPNDEIKVRLTVKEKTPRAPDHGEVRWHALVTNQNDEVVADYEVLTLNAT